MPRGKMRQKDGTPNAVATEWLHKYEMGHYDRRYKFLPEELFYFSIRSA